MRKAAVALVVVIALGILIGPRVHSQGPAERPTGQADNCYGQNLLGPESAVRLSVAGDITKPGPHRAKMEEISAVVIYPSRAWGGGKLTIPSRLISATFTIEPLPGNTRPVDPKGRPVAEPELRSFRIADVNGAIKSFAFPRNVETGDNAFKIIKEKSYIQVHGSGGVVAISGEAQAWLTNKVFGKPRPARVRVSFWGTYNYDTRTVNLSKFEAHAHSPSK